MSSTANDERESEAPGTPVRLSIEALSDRYDESDERWHDQVVDLVEQLRESVGTVQRRQEASPGQKGAVDTMIIALGSAGAFQATVAVFRAWLARDRSRRLRLVVTDAHQRQRTVELQGDSVDNQTLREVAEVVARRLPMT
jgi:hypothetical protein